MIRKFISRFKAKEKPQPWVDFELPKSLSAVPDYKTAFEHAILFTKSCGFPISDFAWKEGHHLDGKGEFLNPILKGAGIKDMSKSATQCLKWCHYLLPFFQAHLPCKVHLTIGQLWNGDKPAFDPSWKDLRRWSCEGIQLSDFQNRSGVNLHAWLTLDTGEIIDPTLLSSYAAVRGGSWVKFAGAVVWGYDPAVLNHHRYFPMAIGKEYSTALASQSIIPLLADTQADLDLAAIMIAPR